MVKHIVRALVATSILAGCLTRPVLQQNPTTHRTIETKVAQTSIDRVDLLFAIDNSASMGDKQDLLASAVPVLVGRLLNPNCVEVVSTCGVASDCAPLGAGAQCDTSANQGKGQCFLPGDGQACASLPSTKPEFAAVHDMHVGIVSSSLGGGGSPDICVPDATDSAHMNDSGHLLNRTVGSPEGQISNAKPVTADGGNFLAWLPTADGTPPEPKNTGKAQPNVTAYVQGQHTELVGDFQKLVSGVGQSGCGLEAQLESWYRFLVQPDPWEQIATTSDNPPKAQLVGVDATLLKMRHDFLRPDSLVAIVQLTDEEDSWSDPLWADGHGWTVRTNTFPGGPSGSGVAPLPTHECGDPVVVGQETTTGPNNPNCTSCGFSGNKPNGDLIASDQNCTACAGGGNNCPTSKPGWYQPASMSTPIGVADGVNARYTGNMRARYGLSPQHDIQRYVDGLRLPTVPDRNHESHDSTQYTQQTQRNCTNPLFAGALPDGSDTSQGTLCDLPRGPRPQNQVFYALIGGVPNRLVEDASGNFKADLGASDWQAILGKDPATYQYDGIDPHMIESTGPRAQIAGPGPSYTLPPDPDSPRDWNSLTSGAHIDLQYACTFTLPSPRDCNLNPASCDCTGTAASDPGGPPLCDVKNRTQQVRGKAYPTIRELRVAKGLGEQAVVASLCAKNVTSVPSDPTYGYNPAMQAIVNRLKNALIAQCLPDRLTRASDQTVPCSVLVAFPTLKQSDGCVQRPGLKDPTSDALTRFDATYIASLGDSGVDTTPPLLCELAQLVPSVDYSGATCSGSAQTGWCYVEGVDNTNGCPQAIEFGAGGPPSGTVVTLECLEQQ